MGLLFEGKYSKLCKVFSVFKKKKAPKIVKGMNVLAGSHPNHVQRVFKIN